MNKFFISLMFIFSINLLAGDKSNLVVQNLSEVEQRVPQFKDNKNLTSNYCTWKIKITLDNLDQLENYENLGIYTFPIRFISKETNFSSLVELIETDKARKALEKSFKNDTEGESIGLGKSCITYVSICCSRSYDYCTGKKCNFRDSIPLNVGVILVGDKKEEGQDKKNQTVILDSYFVPIEPLLRKAILPEGCKNPYQAPFRVFFKDNSFDVKLLENIISTKNPNNLSYQSNIKESNTNNITNNITIEPIELDPVDTTGEITHFTEGYSDYNNKTCEFELTSKHLLQYPYVFFGDYPLVNSSCAYDSEVGKYSLYGIVPNLGENR